MTGPLFVPRPLPAQKSQGNVTLSTADIAERSLSATVTILAIDERGDTLSQGSGFLIRDDGVVVTNFHVLRGAASAVVILGSQERYERVHVLDADSVIDLALLKIPGADLPILRTRTSAPRIGARAIAIGSPLGLSRSVSEGIVSAIRLVNGRQLIQITTPISPGSSGGAVLDASGKVFAVSTSYLSGGQAINFAVPVRYALGLLSDQPKAKTIAQVFSGLSSPSLEQGTGTASRDGSANAAAIQRRNPHPRSDVSGTYLTYQRWYDAKDSAIAGQKGLLISTPHGGFLVLSVERPDSSLGPAVTFSVSRWATNDSGDIVLESGGVTYDGYQTADDGFLATGSAHDDSTTLRAYLAGIPKSIPLSNDNGLYDVSVRTTYSSKGWSSPSTLDWTGDAAIVVSRDSIHVNLLLRNSSGGTSGIVARGAIDQRGSFSLKAETVALFGTLENGLLSAQWVDRRGDAAFVGDLHGTRR